jgi:hypothetical protein
VVVLALPVRAGRVDLAPTVAKVSTYNINSPVRIEDER